MILSQNTRQHNCFDLGRRSTRVGCGAGNPAWSFGPGVAKAGVQPEADVARACRGIVKGRKHLHVAAFEGAPKRVSEDIVTNMLNHEQER
jgi:hypothetical protein